MSRYFILLVIMATCLTVKAQSVEEIATYYKQTLVRIAESTRNPFEGPLYTNRYEVNRLGRSWPAVGNYNETTDLWYEYPPDGSNEKEPAQSLVKVNRKRQASHYLRSEEFLYRDGVLLFYYCQENEEGMEWQTRVYFNKDGKVTRSYVKENDVELTDVQLKGTHSDHKPDHSDILTQSKKFTAFFINGI